MKSSWRILISWMLIVAMVGTAVQLSTPVQAETDTLGTWSSPQVITASGDAGIFPEIAVDTTGVIHTVYEETPDLTAGRLRYTNNRTGSFGAGTIISGNFNQIELAAIDTYNLNGQVQVHVVFAGRLIGQNNSLTRVYYVFSPDGGTTWTAPVNIIGNRAGFQADITVDDLGYAHVAFNSSSSASNFDALAVFYVTNKTGAWSAPEKAGDRKPEQSYNGFPSLTTNLVDNVVTVHMFFMGQENGGGQLGKWVFSTRKVGNGPWAAAQVRGTRSANFPETVSFANNVYAVWEGGVAGSSATDLDIFYAVSADNGATWSAPVIIGNNRDAQGTRVGIGRAIDGSLSIVWDDQANALGGNTDIWSNYSPNGLTWQGAAPLFQGVGFSLESEVAGSCEYFHAVWHDSNQGGTFKVFFSQTGPTVTPNCNPPVTPVTFTLNRTNTSPSKTPTIAASLTSVTGSPNQVRFATTPFQELDTSVPWVAFTNALSVNFTASPGLCSYNLYVQARNTETGEFSAVQMISTIVDVSVQAGVVIYSMEDLQNRPESNDEIAAVQPHAPDILIDEFTRNSSMFYSISQEPVPCVGVKSHTAESFTPTSSAYPYEGFVPFDNFDVTNDNNGGLGYNEQEIEATVVVTDQLDNARVFTKTFFYDDDPPVISDTNTVTVTSGLTAELALATVVFDANITDDGYSDYLGQPGIGYWGAWVLASDSATVPTPAEFEQYGSIYRLNDGSTTIPNVPLVNDLNAQTQQPGPRYIHIRFLDGAGNYSETALTSPEINLTSVNYPTVFLPILRK